MKKAKGCMKRMAVLLAVCTLAVLCCSAAFADGERVTVRGETRRVYWRSTGNGSEISIFQVSVYRAPATIHFRQEEGLCYEDSITHYIDGRNGQEEEWGKYHIYYQWHDKYSSSTTYVDWDKTRKGGSFDLYLNRTGTYYIWVVPYTAKEMTDSWTLDTFNSWNKSPYWWVDSWTGAEVCSAPYAMDTNGRLDTGSPLSISSIIH